jgi:hypothetical protein
MLSLSKHTLRNYIRRQRNSRDQGLFIGQTKRQPVKVLIGIGLFAVIAPVRPRLAC